MVSLHGRSLALHAIAALASAALLASCSSSSETQTVTSPSAVRCTVQLQADRGAFASTGGSGTVQISTNRECSWSTKSDAAWLTVATPAEGQGDGTVGFTVAGNADTTSRSAGITVNDQRVAISQEGTPCEFTLSSTRTTIDGAGGNLTIQVRATAAQCGWTAAANVPWITIVSGRDGRGSGEVGVRVDPVAGPPRIGTLLIAGQTVTVEEGTGCSYAIGTDAFTLDPSGGERQVSVSAPSGCAWAAESHASWITIGTGAAGSGPGLVVFRVTGTDGPARNGTLTIAGRTVTVAQSPGCTYTIGTDAFTLDHSGGDRQVSVSAASGCGWAAESHAAWITIGTGAAGNGPGLVAFSVAGTDGPARSGTLTIAGRTVTVAQSPGCSVAVSPTNVSAGAQGITSNIQITTAAGCGWAATSSASWITIGGTASGSGPGPMQVIVAANSGPARTGSISVAGQTVSVAQANGCTYGVAPLSQDIPGNGAAGTGSVMTASGCTWTATSSVDWITVSTPSGAGPGQISFTVAPNPGPSRTGGISIAGQLLPVNQASLCTWVFAPPMSEFDARAATATSSSSRAAPAHGRRSARPTGFQLPPGHRVSETDSCSSSFRQTRGQRAPGSLWLRARTTW